MQKEKLVPAIRFKGFEEEWKYILIQDIISSLPYKKYINTPISSGSYPIIQQGSEPISGFANGVPFIHYNNVLVFGDHTLSLYKPKSPFFVASDGVRILQSKKGYSIEFVHKVIEKYLPDSHGYTRHFGILKMQQGKISVIQKEQQKIGKFFSSLDLIIESQKSKLEKLQTIKQSLLNKMFASDNQKMPDIRFKDFLDAWNHKLVKSLGYITTGNSNTQDSDVNGAYPFFIRSDKPLKSNKYLYDEEAVITIGDGNIGKVFHYINGKFDLHQRCYKISNFTDVLGKYFYWYFSSNFYDRVIRMSAKATVDSVRLEMIADMEIYFPSNKNEQSKISIFLDSIDSLIHSQEQKLEKLNNIKQALLEKMFC
ncbi:restriction endonuclease subunit S [Mycoplasma sp. Sp48II]|uniref:restriction endonuclease subunit S n=1 Tax=unclassified Mycoplasma TaxID=2683645 RepID=UPI003AAC62AC